MFVDAPALQNGDLLFLVAADSPMSDAITAATSHADDLKFDHVAMIYMDSGGNPCVIEASPKEGVHALPLDEFIAGARKIDGQPGVVVMRLQVDFPAEEAVVNASQHIGEDYDWFYLPDNGMMYCSELIYESYLDEEGNHIFEAKPMNFRAEDGSMPDFWVKLYEQLGEPIPEGEPGTNPRDLSKDQKLVEIYRYF